MAEDGGNPTRWILEHPAWAGITGIVTILALGVAVAAALLGSSNGDGGDVGGPGTVETTVADPASTSGASPTNGDATPLTTAVTSTTAPAPSETETSALASSFGSAEAWACPEVPVLPLAAPPEANLDPDGDDCPVLEGDYVSASSRKEITYDLSAGQRVVVSIYSPGDRSQFEMLDPNGATIARDDNANSSETYTFDIATNGTYTAAFTSAGNDGSYTIRVLQVN